MASSKDFLLSGVIEGANIQISLCSIPLLTNEGILRHNMDPVAGHLFGRSLCAATLLSPMLCEGEKYHIIWGYEGAFSKQVIECSKEVEIRGTFEPVHLANIAPTLDKLFGQSGTVSVIKSKNGKELESGTSDAPLKDPVTDLGWYFSTHSQIETAFSIFITFNTSTERPVRLCHGVILQSLLDCDFDMLENLRGVIESDPFRQEMMENSFTTEQFKSFVRTSFDNFLQKDQIKFHNPTFPKYQCTCSREKTTSLFLRLSEKEKNEIVFENRGLTVNCNFCGNPFHYEIEELKSLFAS